jgi:transcriptional repressor NrdR
VGMAVLARLRELDPVAYLRFASVYKGFEELADFEREVGELQRDLARRDLGGSLQKTTEPKGRRD